MPPVLLISDASSHLFYGMYNHPFFIGTQKILQSIRNCSSQHVTLYELDGATGNERLFNYFLSEHMPGPLIDMVKCRNHQSNLIEGTLLMASNLPGGNMLSLFYSVTNFLRTSGQWFRLKQAASDWIGDNAVVHVDSAHVDHDQEACRQEHAGELKDYLECSEKMQSSIRQLKSEQPSQRTKLQRRLDDFFAS